MTFKVNFWRNNTNKIMKTCVFFLVPYYILGIEVLNPKDTLLCKYICFM